MRDGRRRPRIVLTCGVEAWAGGGKPPPKASLRANLRVEYVRAVERAGGAPLLLAEAPDPAVAREAMAWADGLLLTGGADVDPAFYGRPRHPATVVASGDRDRTERAAAEAAIEAGKPILGICRGIQLLNVVLGGTLIQDLSTHRGVPGDFEPDGPHGPERPVVNHKGRDHAVWVEAAASLARIWPRDGLLVNSRHHQAVEDLAPGLRTTAWAADGIVEAVESADGLPLLAVQCHPEDLVDRPEFLGLFRWLVERARGC
ncbi:MAG TPA: gamma-glutamyl-gamma-aminobutyrate hydrolase family protein [Phycisphaerae bacterium]|nr:gamma-glutamyl-gamma-aminobutyrate hydrolase family protein [Phycisphaerae bacterium]